VWEGVAGLVAVSREPGVSVAETGSVAVGMAVPVFAGEEGGARVSVISGNVVETEAGERIRSSKEFPKAMATTANSTIAREKPSHCLPASIRAWRVR
jgi:hypothetical protein